MKYLLSLAVAAMVIYSCNNDAPPQGDWIKGSIEQQLEITESQFRGFDKTMMEVGYRYQELYWGGKDQNWPFAKYQLEKIEKTIRLGLERRPKRAASAQHFLNEVIPDLNQAIAAKDSLLFQKNFEVLRTNCISCHMMEGVPTFKVLIPTDRQSPIGY